MEVRIRTAQREDARELARLTEQLGYDVGFDGTAARLRDLRPDERILVAELGGRVAGWLEVRIERVLTAAEPRAFVSGLVVDAELRGRGVGRALVEQACGWARSAGARSLRLRTRVERGDARVFYERLGFERVKSQVAYTLAL